MYVYMYLI